MTESTRDTPPAAVDVFVSYAREDLGRVRVLVDALTGAGWSVFWDRKTPAGTSWRDYIGHALAQARCVIVVWSDASIASTFVAEEADEGQKRQAMVPVLFDPVLPPFGFRSVHAADLSTWTGDRADPAWIALLGDLRGRLGTPPVPPPPPPPPPQPQPPPPPPPASPAPSPAGAPLAPPLPTPPVPPLRRRWIVAAAAALLLGVGLVWAWLHSRPDAALRPAEAVAPEPALPPASTPADPADPAASPATPPVSTDAAPPARPAGGHATDRTRPARPVDPRCSDLLQRLQLGESLGTDDQGYYNSRCTGQ